MRRSWLLAFLLWACSSGGPQSDLPAIAEARSLGAGWALVNQEAAQGRLTRTYAETMRSKLREQLQSAATSLNNPRSVYGAEIRGLLNQPEEVSPEVLRAHVLKLKQIEDGLESA